MTTTPGPVKITQLPAATAYANTDLFVVVTGVAANASVTNKVQANVISATLLAQVLSPHTIPGPYTNDSAANTAGILVGALYYDASGIARIRLS